MTVEKQLLTISDRIAHTALTLIEIINEVRAENPMLALSLIEAGQHLSYANTAINEGLNQAAVTDTFIQQVNEGRQI